jgi:predicted Rossmann fold nucleotide-binding protein DprA/Smf involved in DNA uptake
MAVIALTTRLGSSQRPSLTAQRWHRLAGALRDSGHSPSDIFDTSLDLHQVPGVKPETADTVKHLLEDAAAATLEAEELGRRGIWVTTIADDEYPPALADRLAENAPPVIFGVGDPGLLSTPGIGIVGSREIGEIGADVAKTLATEAVSLGRSVVSGGARGIDQLAMNAAYQSGGSVIGVLADSMLSRIRSPEVLEALDEGGTCLLTQQAPTSGFSPAAAMSRNKLIFALSELTIVVASDQESGGTWAGATEALKMGNGQVVVWRGDGEGPGNSELERLGAVPIKAIGELRSLLETSSKPPEQLSLIDGAARD